MEVTTLLGIAILIRVIGYFIAFWLSLWILKRFVKNKNNRYVLVGILNAFLPPLSFFVRFSQLDLATYLIFGLPILGWMYWRDRSLTSAGRSSSL
ncbi:hypothetical protein H6F90_08195 [Trichocoleus sp. FACHB-591]|uniref:hypothetical protein n=1 Tax=Trichocoleus sp. FACHB-591 TaxID=2692872 RepID=UPI001683B3B0|nr:hypothetical protein [Trichocoleus sp. FACHB-591]MBD2095134.1 hypothetical protein [Trichocoleus sp. FACHB-591]